MKVIAIAGGAESGKDALGRKIQEQMKFTPRRGVGKIIGISEEIVISLCSLLDLDPKDFDTHEGKREKPGLASIYGEDLCDLTRRKLLQDYANGVRAKFGNDFWARQALRGVKAGADGEPPFHAVILTGVRLDDEITWLRDTYKEDVFVVELEHASSFAAFRNSDITERGVCGADAVFKIDDKTPFGPIANYIIEAAGL